jgi:hypothetical protein
MKQATVDLTGTPQELGQRWGQINATDIRAHLAQFLELARTQHQLGEAELVRRAEPYCDMMGELAPHWLIEAQAAAEAAGVEVPLYHAFLAGKYRGLLFHEECTSYAAVGSATADGRPLFHKNRDNVLRPQAFYRKHTIGAGRETIPFLAVGDTSDTGVMMMVNAAGLAGSADQAGREPRPHFRGLMNPYGLRLIAETATTCDEAVEVARAMTASGFYAGGDIVTRWAFTDRNGTAVTVLNTHDQCIVEQRTQDGAIWTVPREGLPELLEGRRGGLTAEDMNEASRLPGVCVPGNCSSMTVAIDPRAPETFTCAWAALGPADRTAYFPLYMASAQTPIPYVNGGVFRYSERPVALEAAATFERSGDASRLAHENAARQALRAGRGDAALAELAAVPLEALAAAQHAFG